LAKVVWDFEAKRAPPPSRVSDRYSRRAAEATGVEDAISARPEVITYTR
jgi:hypothetical protein